MNKIFIIATFLLTVSLLAACTPKQNNISQSPTPSAVAISSPTPTETAFASPSATPTPTKIGTPKPSTQPLIDCVGPDGKTAKMTKKACDDFNKSWNKQTATPVAAANTQVTGCAAYNPTGALGTARVKITIESGQSWVGQAGIDFSEKYPECKGNGLDYTYADVISGPYTHDFGGLRPGPYKISVTYHGKNWSSDVNVQSGTSEVTVTVSNN